MADYKAFLKLMMTFRNEITGGRIAFIIPEKEELRYALGKAWSVVFDMVEDAKEWLEEK